MNQIIPTAGTPICISDVVRIESVIAQQIVTIDDVTALEEMRAKADALARYLQSKALHGPMLGAQRRIEARIGQLLGEPSHAPGSVTRELHSISRMDRKRFRQLARGFDVLTDEDWRQSRRSLIRLLQEKFPSTRVASNHGEHYEKNLSPDLNEGFSGSTDLDEPKTDEPERPDMEALDREAAESYTRARQESLDKLLDGNDALAAAAKEIERQAQEILCLKVSLSGEMNGKSAAIKRFRAKERECARLERVIQRANDKIHDLTERIAQIEEPAC